MKKSDLVPVLSEKSLQQSEIVGAYSFFVSPELNRVQAVQLIEAKYGVSVVGVSTLRTHQKTKRSKFGPYRVPQKKRVIVRLKAGDRIDFTKGI